MEEGCTRPVSWRGYTTTSPVMTTCALFAAVLVTVALTVLASKDQPLLFLPKSQTPYLRVDKTARESDEFKIHL